jgi:phosphoribosylformylglycinamidine synthase
MGFLHEGICKYDRVAKWETKKLSEPVLEPKDNFNDDLLKILGSYNVASKEWVIRQYDHEVQGGSVIKPLMGTENDGPMDAAVIRPKYDHDKGVALSCGMNPCYGDIDPYWMALAGIDEAVRNRADCDFGQLLLGRLHATGNPRRVGAGLAGLL